MRPQTRWNSQLRLVTLSCRKCVWPLLLRAYLAPASLQEWGQPTHFGNSSKTGRHTLFGNLRALAKGHEGIALYGSSSLEFSSTIWQVTVRYGGNRHDIQKCSKQVASGALCSLVWNSRSDHVCVTRKAACSGTRGRRARRGSAGRGALHIGTSGRGEGVISAELPSCHGASVDDGSTAPPLRGSAFLAKYTGKPAADLFT